MVEGLQLEAACFGPPPEQAPTLVLLHEGLGCVALWRDFPEKLATATGNGVFVYSPCRLWSVQPVFPAETIGLYEIVRPIPCCQLFWMA